MIHYKFNIDVKKRHKITNNFSNRLKHKANAFYLDQSWVNQMRLNIAMANSATRKYPGLEDILQLQELYITY